MGCQERRSMADLCSADSTANQTKWLSTINLSALIFRLTLSYDGWTKNRILQSSAVGSENAKKYNAAPSYDVLKYTQIIFHVISSVTGRMNEKENLIASFETKSSSFVFHPN